MPQRRLLIRYESGHALRAVPAGGDPYTEGTNLTDHGDGFYSAVLPVGVYDIYYKNQPDDATWIPLEHYQGRFHPTDEITEDISQIQGELSELSGRVDVLEGTPPATPQNVEIVKTAEGLHIRWSPGPEGTLYILRGVYHHTGEQVSVDENSRILYAGYVPECLLPNGLRFADIEGDPFGEISLDFRLWAKNFAGTSAPTETFSAPLDLAEERLAFCEGVCQQCSESGAPSPTVITTQYPGVFPKTPVDSQFHPEGEPARTLSFHRDIRILRVEAESVSPAEHDCTIYLCDAFSGKVYSLMFSAGERIARSEGTPAGNPALLVMRYPDSKLLIYSDDPAGLQDVEIRLTVAFVG